MSTRIRSGFTLIEALAALTISSAAVAIGYASFVRAVDTRERANIRMASVVRAAALREQLREWLASAHTPVGAEGYRFDLVDTNGDGSGDELTFVTLRAAPITYGQAEVTLRWARNGNASLLIAELREVATGADITPPVVLSEWVGSLSIRVRPELLSGWQGHWSSALSLPHAVEVRLATVTPDSLDASVQTPLVVQLHATQ